MNFRHRTWQQWTNSATNTLNSDNIPHKQTNWNKFMLKRMRAYWQFTYELFSQRNTRLTHAWNYNCHDMSEPSSTAAMSMQEGSDLSSGSLAVTLLNQEATKDSHDFCRKQVPRLSATRPKHMVQFAAGKCKHKTQIFVWYRWVTPFTFFFTFRPLYKQTAVASASHLILEFEAILDTRSTYPC
jgi:hypothetical protein